MKKSIFTFSCFLLLLMFSFGNAFAQGSHEAQPLGSTAAPYGYYEYLPENFNSSSKEFPLIIFLHGAGERGNGKSELKEAVKFGPGREINDGKDFSFVILSPQTNDYWNVEELDNFIEYAVKEYNIDEDRIYLTGLSMGAMGLLDYLEKYSDKIAAVVPIAGSGDPSKACNYSDVPLWAFHGDQDPTVPISGSKNVVNAYNNCKPTPDPKAKLTVMKGKAHWGWNDVYDRSLGDIYGWMLQFAKDGKAEEEEEPKPNAAPVVDAGNDKSTTLPDNSLSIEGKASDSDGKIVSYQWAKVKGPSVEMEDKDTKTLQLDELEEGTYTFRLTAKDNGGAEGKDEVKVVVKGEEKKNKAPVADAGSDHTVTLPVEEVVLSGSGKDKDGELVAFNWEKISGPSLAMDGASTANIKLSNLQEGSYQFRFTVEDNDGATDSDEVKVKVKPAPSNDEEQEEDEGENEDDDQEEVSITALAGDDDEVALPLEGGLVIHGSIKLVNGDIGSYEWEKVGGPSVNIKSNKTANLEIADLQEGVYTFRFTATTTTGESDSDDMKLKVLAAAETDNEDEEEDNNGGGGDDDEGEATGQGLSYAYYEISPNSPWSKLPDFGGLTPVKTGTVDEISVSPREQANFYAFVFEGYIDIDEAGTYFFYTDSDEGSKLFIDGRLVVDNDGVHKNQVVYNSIELESGLHEIRVEYFENVGNEKLFVSYKGPGVPLQEIPSEKLYPSGNINDDGAKDGEMLEGLVYTYYETEDPENRSWVNLPDFEQLKAEKSGVVANFSLDPRERDDHFGFVYEGWLKIEEAGYYTFYLNSDDGSKLFVNDKLIIDNDGWHAPFEKAEGMELEAGYHPIRVTYYEHAEIELLEVKWEGPGFGKQLIPANALYHQSGQANKAARIAANQRTATSIFDAEEPRQEAVAISLYPNPARNSLNLQLNGLDDEENITLTILDMSGREVHSRHYQPAASGRNLRLNLQEMQLIRGTYVMVIKNEAKERIKTLRFIKQ